MGLIHLSFSQSWKTIAICNFIFKFFNFIFNFFNFIFKAQLLVATIYVLLLRQVGFLHLPLGIIICHSYTIMNDGVGGTSLKIMWV